MTENDLPIEAILDPATFVEEDRLHGLLARLRRTDPFPYVETDKAIPFWLATRYETVVAIELDSETFLNAPRQNVLPSTHEQRSKAAAGDGGVIGRMRNLTGMDGDEHRTYRALTQSHFMSKAVSNAKAAIHGIATHFVDRMVAMDGECDFATDVAMLYPLRVIMTLLGVPEDKEPEILRLAQQMLTSQDPEFRRTEGGFIEAMEEMFAIYRPIIADRRANPREDLASVIANARIGGEYLPDRDLMGYFVIASTAGHDTTSYTLASGMAALLQHPDEFARLRANPTPEAMPLAVDELLRWATPVKHMARTAARDCVVEGKQVKAGDVVMLSYPSANRDEAVFEDPFRLKLDRRPNRHLAFGTGPHLCLGQHLARVELSTFLSVFMEKIGEIELAGKPEYVVSSYVSGVKHLPVRYKALVPA